MTPEHEKPAASGAGDQGYHEGEHLELHEMRPTTRFSSRADDYARYRPDYPPAAIDAVLEGLGDPAALRAADVGAGTGISSRLMAERGVRVIAIEPNAEMRAESADHSRIEWRDGTAEETGVAPASLDLVLSAQAFHWFRQPEALAEFARVLRPGGRLALMWNSRDRSDPGTRGFVEAIHAVNGEHPAERRPFDPAVVERSGRFTPVTLTNFPHHQTLDLMGVIGRARSASYVPKEGAGFARLEELMRAVYAEHRDAGGTFNLRYVTQLYRAQRL